jgi:hypothetical protein
VSANHGHFLNIKGYTLVEDKERSAAYGKAIYEYTAVKKHPLTYVDKQGDLWRPDNHFFTDQGTVPKLPQILIPKDRFLGFYFHDSARKFGGLWKWNVMALDNAPTTTRDLWVFQPLPIKQTDAMLYDMAMADPVTPWHITAAIVLAAVSINAKVRGSKEYGKGDMEFRGAK